MRPARDAGAGALVPNGAMPHAPGISEPHPHMLPPAQRAGARRDGAVTPHADPVRRAHGPRMQVMQGAPGGAALLLQAPGGASSTGASGGNCALVHAVWAERLVRALPPPPP